MTKRRLVKLTTTVFVGCLAFTMIFPFLWMLSASAKVEGDVFAFPIQWIPPVWNAGANYSEVWFGDYGFASAYWNSIKITLLTTWFQVILSTMGAYAFAKINFKFRDTLFLLYLATLMIPEQVTLVPRFMIIKLMNLFDTHAGLILMGSFSVFGVFLLRQFIIQISDAIVESAKIDGSSHLRIFIRIIVPMIQPALATLIILKFVWTWNDYQNPLIFLHSSELFTIQLGMKQFSTQVGQIYSLTMAASVSAIIPLCLVFILGQKYVVSGIAMGGVKG